MSEHEFEQFLAIFRGMLRLNPAQRDEIAAELMDHLQERLAELTARGMSRDRAVQVALEEFGDAAGLAAQFLLVVSQQRRRRIMKWTAGSVMAAMVVLYGAYAFWPAEPARGPGSSPAVAQEKTAPAEPKKKKKVATETPNSAAIPKNDATQEVEQRLTEKMAASFLDVPLQDFLELIGTEAKVDFYVDKAALEEAGIGTDKVVTVNLKNIRIDKLLDLALGQIGLVWVPRDGYVFVTTQEKLGQQLETRVYNCRDLIELALFGSSQATSGGMGMPGGEGGYGGGPAGGGAGMASAGGHGGMPGMGMSGMAMGSGMMPGGMPSGGMAAGGMMPGGMMPGTGGMMGGMGSSMGASGRRSWDGRGWFLHASVHENLDRSDYDDRNARELDTGWRSWLSGRLSRWSACRESSCAGTSEDRPIVADVREASKDRPGAVVRER